MSKSMSSNSLLVVSLASHFSGQWTWYEDKHWLSLSQRNINDQCFVWSHNEVWDTFNDNMPVKKKKKKKPPFFYYIKEEKTQEREW